MSNQINASSPTRPNVLTLRTTSDWTLDLQWPLF